ncbi:DASH family cryptochrome [Thalassotalea sp. PS06]|uniref:DASH family cryptochrome n=1 Tax=Thalassotalea sp. PS06 TaxID=2594005 RepID=UPI001161D1F0|nr:DASH family cryptochrome [Thalassotalea sp. PS06]QDP02117.1 DASH family cryptochrome [Thalassotalea sp. PS06]
MRNTLYCFTLDLRIADNHLLQAAIDQSKAISFVYVVDPSWFKPSNYHHQPVGELRRQFIWQSLQDLQQELSSQGFDLTILYGETVGVLSTLLRTGHFDSLAMAETAGVYESQQRQALLQLHPDVQLLSDWSHTLYTPSQLRSAKCHPEQQQGWKSFSYFRRKVEKANLKPFALQSSHFIGVQPIRLEHIISQDKELKTATLEHLQIGSLAARAASAAGSDLYGHYAYQLLGGERAAHDHLQDYFLSGAASTYKQTRNALDGRYTATGFSPYLAIGNLSPRQVYWSLKQFEQHHGGNESTYWIYFELLWREYFQWLALAAKHRLFRFRGLVDSGPLTSFFPERFEKWCQGNTPYPIVNACMHQLNATGFMSNRGRQLVASCLVNELGVDWRYGAAYFQQQLIDYDVASNWGNWQYIAGVGVDPRGGRHFNLNKQTQMFDPDGDFIRRWQGQGDGAALDSVDAVDWPVV